MQKYLFGAALHPEVKTRLPETSLVGEIVAGVRATCVYDVHVLDDYNSQGLIQI